MRQQKNIETAIQSQKNDQIPKSKQNKKNHAEVTDELDQILKKKKVEELCVIPDEIEPQNVKMNYQKISQKKVGEWFHVLAFNNDQTIIIAVVDRKIMVFSFEKEKLKLQQTIPDQSINGLYFMKKSNQFISAGYDKILKLWSINQKSHKWYCQSFINAHEKEINQVIMDQDEETIITCSDDSTIKFWLKSDWECSQTLKCHADRVYTVNESQNQLVSCGKDNLICISQKTLNQWEIMQKIEVEGEGNGACFITNEIFLYQPRFGNLQLFKMNNKLYSLQETNIPIRSRNFKLCFPLIFNKQKQIIAVRDNDTIKLVKLMDSNTFELQQEINISCDRIYGNITPDGEYMFMWDEVTEKIQIRKFEYSKITKIQDDNDALRQFVNKNFINN